MRNWVLSIATGMLLAACTTTQADDIITRPRPAGTVTRPAAPPPQVSQPAPSTGGFRVPQVMNLPGLEGVIGKNATALANIFGAPRLTVNEGDAQKLQFAGPACVLDVYLYPLRQGAQPTATYIDARRASDGQDVDRAACVSALRR